MCRELGKLSNWLLKIDLSISFTSSQHWFLQTVRPKSNVFLHRGHMHSNLKSYGFFLKKKVYNLLTYLVNVTTVFFSLHIVYMYVPNDIEPIWFLMDFIVKVAYSVSH